MDYSLQYYDLVLVVIATSLMVGVIVGVMTTFALSGTVAGASILAVGVIGHALFVNGPVDEIDDLDKDVQLEELPMGETVAEVVS